MDSVGGKESCRSGDCTASSGFGGLGFEGMMGSDESDGASGSPPGDGNRGTISGDRAGDTDGEGASGSNAGAAEMVETLKAGSKGKASDDKG